MKFFYRVAGRYYQIRGRIAHRAALRFQSRVGSYYQMRGRIAYRAALRFHSRAETFFQRIKGASK